ncbi:MAG: S1 family peptidase [Candidatus Nanopelagicales bacterium]
MTRAARPRVFTVAGAAASASLAAVVLVGFAQPVSAANEPRNLNGPQVRVIGGSNANRSGTSWFLQFTPSFRGEQMLCGATALSRRWAVTAAHCVKSGPDGLADTGSRGSYVQVNPSKINAGTRYRLNRIVVHPDYKPNSRNQRNDLALIRTSSRMPSGRLGINTSKSSPQKGAAAQVFGFGERISGDSGSIARYLQVGNLKDLTGATGKKCGSYGGTAFNRAYQVCAGLPQGGVDACQGDSGGPLTSRVAGRTRLVGIVSTGTGCGLARYPGIYTRVSTYASWINRIVFPPHFTMSGKCTKRVCKVCKSTRSTFTVKNVSGSRGTWKLKSQDSKLRISKRRGALKAGRSTAVSFSTRSRAKTCVKVQFQASNTPNRNLVVALNHKRGCRP